MLRYTLTQMRTSLKRLTAVSTAVIVSTGFVAAALIGSSAMRDTLYNMVGARYADSDLIVHPAQIGSSDFDSLREAARQVDGVEAAVTLLSAWVEVKSGGRAEYMEITEAASDQRLNPQPVTDGVEPAGGREVSMGVKAAERLGVAVGDTVELAVEYWSPSIGIEEGVGEGVGEGDVFDEGQMVQASASATVTGLFDDSTPTLWQLPAVQASPATLKELVAGAPDDAGLFWIENVAVAVAAGTDLGPGSEMRTRLGEAFVDLGHESLTSDEYCQDLLRSDPFGKPQSYMASDWGCLVRVLDLRQETNQMVAEFMDGAAILVAVVLIFGLLGMFVAGMAISNTYQVLIAGRTRTLALLRAVGATRKQVRRTVLLEGAIMGLGGALGGLILGWALIQAALWIAGGLYPSLPLPGVARPTWVAVVASVAAGGVTTLIASTIPARLASRVPALAALHPLAPPKLASRAGKVRLGLSIGMCALGLAGLTAGLTMNNSVDLAQADSERVLITGSILGVLGGGVLVVSVLVGAVFWLPKVVSLVAGIFSRFGGAARIAAANAVRNPRRTSAAAGALVIGVTLVTGLIVAAASIGASLGKEVSRFAPIDVQVGDASVTTVAAEQTGDPDLDGQFGQSSLSNDLIAKLRAVDGVEQVVEVRSGTVGVADNSGQTYYYTAFGIDRDGFQSVVRDKDMAGLLQPGKVLVDDWFVATIQQQTALKENGSDPAFEVDAEDVEGTTLELIGPGGQTAELEWVDRPDYEAILPYEALVVDLATLRELGAAESVPQVWLKVDDQANAADVVADVQDAVTEHTGSDDSVFLVQGSAVERANIENAVDVMLIVGLALLAVSVIVALVGVSNTLWLSVLERARETAMLRALGLTRRQTTRMMALEGAIIAGVAGLTGVALGTFFGLAGCGLLLSATEFMSLTVPLGRVGLVLVLAILTGLVASILPGRRAAKTPPAQALAAEG